MIIILTPVRPTAITVPTGSSGEYSSERAHGSMATTGQDFIAGPASMAAATTDGATMVMATTAEVIMVEDLSMKASAVIADSTVETASMKVIVDFMAVKASVTADADFMGAMAGFTAAVDSSAVVATEAGITNQKFA